MKLPVISGRKLIKFLKKKGFRVVRQRGSHVSLHKIIDHKTLLVVVPLKKRIEERYTFKHTQTG